MSSPLVCRLLKKISEARRESSLRAKGMAPSWKRRIHAKRIPTDGFLAPLLVAVRSFDKLALRLSKGERLFFSHALKLQVVVYEMHLYSPSTRAMNLGESSRSRSSVMRPLRVMYS
jgi:hypothetical protein